MAAPSEAPIASATLRFEDCRVTASSSDPADLEWLAAFLACGFDPAPPHAGDYRVALVVDAGAYDRLFAAGLPGTGARVEGFARDAEPSLLEGWPPVGAGRVFRDPRKPIFYRLSDDGRGVEILARERTPKCRTTLMRVVRELAMERIVATGGTLLHGSAIAVAGGVVAICGPKGSGKTTLLMALLEGAGAGYVANDRCVLRLGPQGVSVRGMPTLVSIRRDTLARFPAAHERLGRIRPDFAGADGATRRSFSMSPPEFCEMMGSCPRASAGSLLALVFPRITDDPSPLALRRLVASEALERLRSGLFRAGHASPLGQAFVSSSDAAPSARRADHQRVVESVPSFDCRLGAGGSPGVADCQRLLECLR